MSTKAKITMILVAVIIAAGIIFYKQYQHQQQLEFEKITAYNDSVSKEEEKRYAILEAKRIAEERERKRLHDSTAIAERHPFTDEELIAMVKKYAPAYSEIWVYRRSKTDWIMLYLRETNFKQHIYIRQFNPVKKRFGNEQELIYVDSKKGYDAYLKKEPLSEIIIDTSRIEIKSAKLNGIWNHDWTDVAIIEATTKSPSQIREERQQRKQRKYRYYYDDDDDDDEEREHEEYDEDCPENNELDINLYYNPKYKPK